ADVEDVLQETFVAVWRGAAGYRSEGAGGWLWGIARRQAALWLRRKRPAESLFADGDVRVVDQTEATLLRAELADAVAALGPVGSTQRETWRLMYVEDRPLSEVAELMGVPEGTVKSRAYHVRRLLRAALRRDDPMAEGGGR
ncbi:MAG TPA: sigma-70 family RNA polymerase sigma factor, partial [Asanoa sp.]|nr:sigma-70 family RNA polymerase sigma factor [Asanoa sp.]